MGVKLIKDFPGTNFKKGDVLTNVNYNTKRHIINRGLGVETSLEDLAVNAKEVKEPVKRGRKKKGE